MMKQLIDFLPLVIFFVLYKFFDIYVATGALIAATAVQVLITYLIYKKVEKMQWVTLVMIVVFGGMTLALQDDNFIKWKVTIVYALFAGALVVSDWMGKPLIKGMLGKEIDLPDNVWKRVSWMWVGFFIAAALLNVYIAFQLPLDVWVNFKVFGLLIGTLLFTLITGAYIFKHLPKEESEE